MPAWTLLMIGLVLILVDVLLFGAASIVLPILAFGAFAAAIASALGLDATSQIVAGSAGAAIAVPIAYFASRYLRGARRQVDEEMQFTVVENNERLGIRVRGDFFTVEAAGPEAIKEGDTVRIVRFQGVTAIVEPVTEPSQRNA
jgi:membrane protein implicated in regulation of membrane protease activity